MIFQVMTFFDREWRKKGHILLRFEFFDATHPHGHFDTALAMCYKEIDFSKVLTLKLGHPVIIHVFTHCHRVRGDFSHKGG